MISRDKHVWLLNTPFGHVQVENEFVDVSAVERWAEEKWVAGRIPKWFPDYAPTQAEYDDDLRTQALARYCE